MGLAEDLIERGGWEWRQGQVTRPQDTMPDIAILTPEYKTGFAYCLAEVFNRVQGGEFVDNRVIARLLATAPELLSFLNAVLEYQQWLADLMEAVNRQDQTAMNAANQVTVRWIEIIELGRLVHAMATGSNPELLQQAVSEHHNDRQLIVSEETRARILKFPRRNDNAEPELPRGPA